MPTSNAIGFRRMSPTEFADYRAYFIPDYGAEIADNYGVTPSEGLLRAEEAIARDLPLGAETQGQVLLCIVNEASGGQMIGYVWYRPDKARRSAFICDFCILAPYRGAGWGKASLAAMESRLRQEGYDEIRLRVAADNPRALHVYESGGFRMTGINMAKRLG